MPQTIDNMSVTWTNSLTTYTGIKLNAAGSSDANSAAGSLLMDLQVGGSSRFKVDKTGAITATLASGTNAFSTNGRINADNGVIGGYDAALNGNLLLGNAVGIRWANSTSWAGTIDTFLTRRGTANLRLGAADAAAPVAQTLSVQSGTAGASALSCSISGTTLTVGGAVTGTIAIGHAVTGTGVSAGTVITAGSGTTWTVNNSQTVSSTTMYFNSVGQNLTITGSQGSGPSAGGSIVFQVAPAGSAGTTAQNGLATFVEMTSTRAFNLYNTFTDASNYERASFGWSSNIFNMLVGAAGTGTQRGVAIGMAGSGGFINFWAGTPVWQITSGGTFQAVTDNVYDIGTSSGSRPRDVYAGTAVRAPVWVFATAGGVQGTFRSEADGVLRLTNSGINDFGRLQFGGTTSSFPALKRNSTALETKLADDSAYAPHAMQYLDVTDGVTAPASATGRARIYVDTADGDLKVIFADGTVKTIVTDT